MPELWLPYGEVEVSVELKAENIAAVVDPRPPEADDAAINRALESVPSEGLLLLATEASSALEVLKKLPKGWVVTAPSKLHSLARRWCETAGLRFQAFSPEETRVQGLPLRLPRGPRPLCVLAEARFDAVFGFDGGPAALLRLSGEALAQVAGRSSEMEPAPGEDGEGHRLATAVVGGLGDVLGIEVVEARGKMVQVAGGGIAEAHREAVQALKAHCQQTVGEKARAAVIAPGGGRHDANLSAALRALWNHLRAVKEGGGVALVAECSEGMGSDAMKLASTGRLSPNSRGYVEGSEDLVFLRRAAEVFKLILVSTLPHHFAREALGFDMASSAEEAAQRLLGRGTRVKVLVAPRGAESLTKVSE